MSADPFCGYDGTYDATIQRMLYGLCSSAAPHATVQSMTPISRGKPSFDPDHAAVRKLFSGQQRAEVPVSVSVPGLRDTFTSCQYCKSHTGTRYEMHGVHRRSFCASVSCVSCVSCVTITPTTTHALSPPLPQLEPLNRFLKDSSDVSRSTH